MDGRPAIPPRTRPVSYKSVPSLPTPDDQMPSPPQDETSPARSRGTGLSAASEVAMSPLKKKRGVFSSLGRKSPSLKQKHSVNSSIDRSDESVFSLKTFAQKYSNQLPLRIEVQSGYCGESNRMSISTNDIFNIHFIKHTSLVKAKPDAGREFTIPLNSALKFCVSSDSSSQDSGNVDVYDRVLDIVALDTLPKVVYVTQSWDGAGLHEGSVTKGELLAIRKVSRSWNKKFLKVCSISDGQKRTLPPECAGYFSTSPQHVALHLSEIFHYVPDPFPCKVTMMIHQMGEEALLQDLPSHITSGFITLLEVFTETTLVASSPNCMVEDNAPGEEIEFADIPVDLPGVEVSLAETKEEEKSHLYSTTKDVIDQFDPGKFKSFQGSESYEVLRTNVRKGFETLGVEVDVNEDIYQNFSFHKKRLEALRNKSDSSSKTESEDVPASPRVRTRSPLPPEAAAKPPHPRKVKPQLSLPPDVDAVRPPPPKAAGYRPQPPLPTDGALNTATPQAPLVADAVKPPSRPQPPVPSKRTKASSVKTARASLPPLDEVGSLPQQPYATTTSSMSDWQPSCPEVDAECIPPPQVHDPVYDSADPIELPPHAQQLPVSTPYAQQVVHYQELIPAKQLKQHMLHDNSSAHEQLSSLKVELAGVNQLVAMLSKRVEELERAFSSFVMNHEKSESTRDDPSVSFIKSLSIEMVGTLLEKMELRQYKEAFLREQVNGIILCDLNEQVLEKDLGVSSRLHRIRLVKVANGKFDVRELFPNS